MRGICKSHSQGALTVGEKMKLEEDHIPCCHTDHRVRNARTSMEPFWV